jgi:hypothetical protein
LTKEAVEVADRLIDVITKARKGVLIPLELVCPDGKTSFKIEVREKEIEVKMRSLLKLCSENKTT